MSKRTRQYIGILAAVIAYYLVHEGAHLLYALFTGVFRQVKFMGLGVQVDIFRERMPDTQLGIFCLVGDAARHLLPCWCCGNFLHGIFADGVCKEDRHGQEQTASRSSVLHHDRASFDRSALPEYSVRTVRRRRYERDRTSAARMGGKDWIRSTSDRKRAYVLETGLAGLQQFLFQYGCTDMNELRARVISQEKGIYKIQSGTAVKLAEIAGKYRYETQTVSDYPAVGDYVIAMWPEDDSNAVITGLFPRKSCFIRKAAGTGKQEQVVAANIDTAFICMSLNNNFNIRRLERYLSVAYESGAAPWWF